MLPAKERFPPETVVVEYAARGGRARKEFTDHFAARRFFAAKLKAGKDPKVIKPGGGPGEIPPGSP